MPSAVLRAGRQQRRRCGAQAGSGSGGRRAHHRGAGVHAHCGAPAAAWHRDAAAAELLRLALQAAGGGLGGRYGAGVRVAPRGSCAPAMGAHKLLGRTRSPPGRGAAPQTPALCSGSWGSGLRACAASQDNLQTSQIAWMQTRPGLNAVLSPSSPATAQHSTRFEPVSRGGLASRDRAFRLARACKRPCAAGGAAALRRRPPTCAAAPPPPPLAPPGWRLPTAACSAPCQRFQRGRRLTTGMRDCSTFKRLGRQKCMMTTAGRHNSRQARG